MSGLAPALMASGSLLTAYSQVQEGNNAAALGKYQAAQFRASANQQIGASQVAAQETQRQTDYIASRALAVAAASGGGASDPTVVNILARIAGEGAYKKSVDIYQGQSAAANLEMQAATAEYGGQATKNASRVKAYSTLMVGGSSLYSKYGGKSPSKPNPAGLYATDIPLYSWNK